MGDIQGNPRCKSDVGGAVQTLLLCSVLCALRVNPPCWRHLRRRAPERLEFEGCQAAARRRESWGRCSLQRRSLQIRTVHSPKRWQRCYCDTFRTDALKRYMHGRIQTRTHTSFISNSIRQASWVREKRHGACVQNCCGRKGCGPAVTGSFQAQLAGRATDAGDIGWVRDRGRAVG